MPIFSNLQNNHGLESNNNFTAHRNLMNQRWQNYAFAYKMSI